MASKQEQLPFKADNVKRRMNVSHVILVDTKKALDKASKAVTVLMKSKGHGSEWKYRLWTKQSRPSQGSAWIRLISVLNGQRSALVQMPTTRRSGTGGNSWLDPPKNAGWPVKRLKECDFAVGFKVNYKLDQVTLRLGSEVFKTFEEPDGASLFSRLQEERSKLERIPFRTTGLHRVDQGRRSPCPAAGKGPGWQGAHSHPVPTSRAR